MESKRVVLVLSDVFVSLCWLSFLVRLIEQWNLLRPDMRECLGAFLVLFCILWLATIRHTKEFHSRMVAFGILAVVFRIAWTIK